MRKNFFPDSVVGHWSKLPREGVMAAGLLVFQKSLDNALRYGV